MSERKVLIIGLDGATWDIMNPLMKNGYMPNLKKMTEEGTRGILKSTKPPITPVAWSSFQTGCNPGKHGIFDFKGYDRKNSETFFVNSTSIRVPTIWEYLSSMNKKIIVLNVPLTYPPKKVNGYIITGFPTPGEESEFTFPNYLKKELQEMSEKWIIPKHSTQYNPHNDFHNFISQMLEILENRLNITMYMMTRYEWDVFMTHFHCVDFIQHPFWKYLDTNHPSFNKDKYEYIASHFYKILDEILKEIEETAKKYSPNLLTVLMSDHGFQAHRKKVSLNKWLYDKGYIRLTENKNTQTANKILKFVRKNDIFNFRKKVIPASKQKKIIRDLEKGLIEKGKSSAFAVGSFWGYLYLNNNHDKLIKDLKEWVDEENGEKIIKKIFKKEELFQNSKLENLPDLVLEPVDGYTFFTHTYFSNKPIILPVDINKEFHVGTHHEDGIFLFKGNGVNAGICEANILDIAPTILYQMGLPIPSYMDGKVIQSVFSEDFKKSRTIKYSDIEQKKSNDKITYTEKESQKIKDRLRNLGYLE